MRSSTPQRRCACGQSGCRKAERFRLEQGEKLLSLTHDGGGGIQHDHLTTRCAFHRQRSQQRDKKWKQEIDGSITYEPNTLSQIQDRVTRKRVISRWSFHMPLLCNEGRTQWKIRHPRSLHYFPAVLFFEGTSGNSGGSTWT